MSRLNCKRGEQLPAIAIRAIDGDTIEVAWSSCYSDRGLPDRVRLTGIDAPELWGTAEVGAYNSRLCLQALTMGQHLTIIPTKVWSDPYGRMVAHVFCNGRDLSESMIALGHAWPFRRQGRTEARLRRLQQRRPHTPVHS